MAARLLVVSIDSMDVDLADEMMAAGELPVLSSLSERAAVVDLVSECFSYLPGGLWFEVHSGRRCWRDGLYQPFAQTFVGEPGSRRVEADDMPLADYWFNMADAAGISVCVVDPTSAPHLDGFSGTELGQYGVHEMYWDTYAQPDELAGRVAEVGGYGVRLCDVLSDGSDADLRQLADLLRAGVKRKGELTVAAVELRDHDVAYVNFSETHCIGHHFWHLHDETSPFRPDDPPADLTGVVREFHRHTDENLGRAVDAAGPGATVVVHLSHGMRHQLSGPQLLPVVLELAGYGSGVPRYDRLRRLMPARLRRLVKAVLPRSFVDRHDLDKREVSAPGTTAFALANNQVGAVRFGVVGRDVGGSVDPSELDAEKARMVELLAGLVEPTSGESIVAEIVDTRERWGGDCHVNIPDLLVVFRRDLGPLEAARLPDGRVVERGARYLGFSRTGDHVPEGRVIVHSADHDLSSVRAVGSNVDLAPTILALLGLEVPAGLDGAPFAPVVEALGTGDAVPAPGVRT